MLTLPPVKGEISLAGVLPFAGVGGSSRTRIIVVVVVVEVEVEVEVVVVVVEYIIILIIIIVDPFETAPAHFCQTVHLESLLFFESAFLHRKMVSRQNGLLLFFSFFLCPGG